MRCKCCGRAGVWGGYAVVGGYHYGCWEEHHSDPRGAWPPRHKCDPDGSRRLNAERKRLGLAEK